MYKVCTKCGVEKPATSKYFYRRKESKDGLRSDCKDCRNSYYQKWVDENQEKVRSGKRLYYLRKQKEYPEYFSWAGMKARCYNKNHNSYKNYGGRGIKVCSRWLNSFENFLNDMGRRPSENHTIDRIDNDKDYSKDNCRWSTPLEQSWNRGAYSNNKTGVTGVTWSKKDQKWWSEIMADGNKIFLGTFSKFDDAVKSRKNAEEEYWKK